MASSGEGRLQDHLRQYLATQSEAVSTTHGVQSVSALIHGSPAAALAAYAEHHRIELVLMTTHGRGGFSRFWLGSVTDRLLRRITVPVLLLHPGSLTPVGQFHCVLIALEATARADASIGPAIALARTTPGSRLVLAHVIEPTPSVLEPTWADEECRRVTTRLGDMARRLQMQGFAATVQVIAGPGVAAQLHALAAREKADLIVVGTRGARGVERLILGSVADKIIRGATQPVLVVPSKVAGVMRHVLALEGAGTAAESGVP